MFKLLKSAEWFLSYELHIFARTFLKTTVMALVENTKNNECIESGVTCSISRVRLHNNTPTKAKHPIITTTFVSTSKTY